MKKILIGMMLLFVTLSTQAQDIKNRNAKYDIEVGGNCDLCK
jgi:periplasmic mercuric ion binding protein